MTEKKKFQEELKKDFENFMEKTKPVMERTGQHLSKAYKSAEEDIGRMYKIAQNKMEIQWNNLQKEKVYHRIGKEVADLLTKGKLDVPELEKYKEELDKFASDNKKIERRIKKITKTKDKEPEKKKGKKSCSSKKEEK